MVQIECRNVSLGYDGVVVSQGVNFSVHAGDYFCIVGDNGSGKSTLMKALLHLNPPEAGEILLGEGIRRSDIGYLPQRSELQRDFPASVREVIFSGFAARGGLGLRYSKEQKDRVAQSMRCLGITELSGRSFRELSGGQQQRVLLCRALCAAEKILLLDEPVGGLDPRATEELYANILHLNRYHGTTIIMITHDLPAVAKYATKVLSMGKNPVLYDSAEAYLKESGLSELTESEACDGHCHFEHKDHDIKGEENHA